MHKWRYKGRLGAIFVVHDSPSAVCDRECFSTAADMALKLISDAGGLASSQWLATIQLHMEAVLLAWPLGTNCITTKLPIGIVARCICSLLAGPGVCSPSCEWRKYRRTFGYQAALGMGAIQASMGESRPPVLEDVGR